MCSSLAGLQTHPWRIVDASNGSVIREYIATAGDQQLTISDDAIGKAQLQVVPPNSAHQGTGASLADADASSFDGIGGGSADYAPAQVCI